MSAPRATTRGWLRRALWGVARLQTTAPARSTVTVGLPGVMVLHASWMKGARRAALWREARVHVRLYGRHGAMRIHLARELETQYHHHSRSKWDPCQCHAFQRYLPTSSTSCLSRFSSACFSS